MTSSIQNNNIPQSAQGPAAARAANAGKVSTNAQPSIASSTPPQGAGYGGANHAKVNSVSPVNGKGPVQPAIPTVNAPPPIVNSGAVANGAPSHGRKSSVNLPNGGSVANSRPPIAFGKIATGASPLLQNSTLQMNPGSRVARSPSPIPQASGGRPPAVIQGTVNFGSHPGSDGGDQTLRPNAMPQGPAGQMPQSQHLRRESSQSAHSDMSSGMGRGFVPNNRQRNFNPPFAGPGVGGSPQPFRPGLNMSQRSVSNVQQYPGAQLPIRPGPNSSPYQANRSPAMANAVLQQQQGHMGAGPPIQHFGYPQMPNQVGPTFSSSVEVAPGVGSRNLFWAHLESTGASPGNKLTPIQGQGMYLPPAFDPNFYAAYQPYTMHQPGPNMPYGAPPSPRVGYSTPHVPYLPQHYNGPHAASMSRTGSSTGPERPGSTLGHPLTPASVSVVPQIPATAGSPAQSVPQFSRPEPKKSKAILIKDTEGNIIDLHKKMGSGPGPAASQPRAPPVVTSGAGIPSPSATPLRVGSTTPQHGRADSHAKSAEEKQREFREQIERQAAQVPKEKEDDAAPKKDDSEAKAKEEAAAKEAKEKEEAERLKKEEEAKKAADEAAKAEEAAKAKAEEERLKKEEEDERWIAELEAQEREDEERERKYQEKKKLEAAEKAEKEKEAQAKLDEELKRQEREAEALEAAKEAGKGQEDTPEAKAESAKLFASLKKSNLGPGATATTTETPTESPTTAQKPTAVSKPKPAALKLETNKPVEPAQPTAGMQSLQSARFLQVQKEVSIYPQGVSSPNPALNQASKSGRGRQYDKNFLLQFKDVFREKPSLDWDRVVKETLGDTSDSSRPASARPSSAAPGRQNSRPGGGMPMPGGVMGNFGGALRTLPAGTTSEQRFQASQQGTSSRGGPISNPFSNFAGGRGAPFGMGAPMMSRSSSSQNMPMQGGGMNSSRNASSRGRGSRRGGPNSQQESQLVKAMPLTAGQDLKPLEVSQTGWKPPSVFSGPTQPALPGTHMAPDMVQRKVKSALNKMTPEKFDKLANDILVIASQSKDETDGRTLRQVIQLTFEKACDEAHWASMYAKFCKRMLEDMGPEIRDENVRDRSDNVVVGGALFRKYLLNRCQEEFERGWEINLPDKPENEAAPGEVTMLSDEYYVAAAAKRRGLGLIQFIGELYKLGMLTMRIMHECVMKLLNFEGAPDESAIESLVKLLRTIGSTMDAAQNGRAMMDTYFHRIQSIMDTAGLPSRMYFMLLDTIELRKGGWKTKDNLKGPKTLQEIRSDAAAQIQQEAQKNRNRPQQGRGDGRSFSQQHVPAQQYRGNEVASDDLKKLARGVRSSGAPSGSLGPNSLLGSRTNSGRRGGLGPLAHGNESGASSRTGTPPVKEKESTAHMNAYSALAGLDSGEGPDDVQSPPSTASSPAVSKAQPAKAADGN
ncbi:hypothetical protein EJ06DRAFT_249028 [Trichodelitschia bisporula]|uniref:MIF4G domain-containing protein n=1 Tax=Trichodelitschia bisporula TaxID=703511 RepID=A0A6G1HJY3_9PEZI|nr:hypothetical protein EJ06DRAFT_249028 [Trichodelitschia bisporula]